jgi:catechol 2,3-dioxygenase-like lactoylglutathione lyase family enzyme
VKGLALNITSGQPGRLRAFYRDALGLAPHPRDPAALEAGGACISFHSHGATAGLSADPGRFRLDFMVDDLLATRARLLSHGVPVEVSVSGAVAFSDPDGNRCRVARRPRAASLGPGQTYR